MLKEKREDTILLYLCLDFSFADLEMFLWLFCLAAINAIPKLYLIIP